LGNAVWKAILFQVVMTMTAALVSGLLVGRDGALSAIIGGGSVALPNAIFALRLQAASGLESTTRARVFLFGVVFKIALILALLLVAVRAYPGLHWISLIAAMFFALQSNVFVLLLKI
jgi:F0F1-type ATP synthase assembly protein I